MQTRTRITLIVVIAMAIPFLALPPAFAADQEVQPLESGQGWFWQTRPQYQPPADQLGAFGDPFANSVRLFARQKLYVGWDSNDVVEKREMISGVAFDLPLEGVPLDATLTRFVVTILEHPQASRTLGNTSSASPDQWLARQQGIIACPWTAFSGGTDAAPWRSAPTSGERIGGDCERYAVLGIPSNQPINPGALPTETVYPWTFDLSAMMADLWSNSENIAFSLEPNTAPDAPKSATWVTAFNSSTIRDPAPGVVVALSWIPAPETFPTGEDEPEEEFTEFTTGGSAGFSPFEPAPPSTIQAGPTEQPQLTAGVAEGPRAPFWDIPFYGWLGALALMALLSGLGNMLLVEPADTQRIKGATSKLMEGGKS